MPVLGAASQAASLGYIHVKSDSGAKGDGRYLTDGAITSGQATLSSASAAFTSADAGKPIIVRGAGAAGAQLITTISSVSGGVATLAVNAGTTVSSGSFWYGTDDTAAFQSAINTANANGGGTIYVPRGIYMIGAGQTSGSINGTGAQAGQTFTYSGQMLFPARAINGSSPVTIEFQGETAQPQVWWSPNFGAADQRFWTSGATLISTAMTGSVFDAISDPSGTQSGDIPGGMTAVMPSFRCMTILIPRASAANHVEAQYCSSFDMKDCTLGVVIRGSQDAAAFPPAATGYALSLPRRGNAAYVVVRDTQIFAVGTGVKHSEHALLDYVTVYWANVGVEVLSSGHLSEYRRLGLWDCGTCIYARAAASINGTIAVETVANINKLIDDNGQLSGNLGILNGSNYSTGWPLPLGAGVGLNLRNLGTSGLSAVGSSGLYPWDTWHRAIYGGLGTTDKTWHSWQAGSATFTTTFGQVKSNGTADQYGVIDYNAPTLSRIVQGTFTTNSTQANINAGLMLGFNFPYGLIAQLDGANNRVNLLKRTSGNTFTTLANGSAGAPGVAASTTYTLTAVLKWSLDPSQATTVTVYLGSTQAVTYTLNGTDLGQLSKSMPTDGIWFNSDSVTINTLFRCSPLT